MLEVDLTGSSSKDSSRANENSSILSKRNKQSKSERDQKAKSIRNFRSTSKVSKLVKEKNTLKKNKTNDSKNDSSNMLLNKTGKRTIKHNKSEKIVKPITNDCICSSDSKNYENTDTAKQNAKEELSLVPSSRDKFHSESTLFEMVNVSKNIKRNHEPENDEESIVSRQKNRRLELDTNHYKNDKKLNMSHKIHSAQLNIEIPKYNLRVLKKPREYLERKELKSCSIDSDEDKSFEFKKKNKKKAVQRIFNSDSKIMTENLDFNNIFEASNVQDSYSTRKEKEKLKRKRNGSSNIDSSLAEKRSKLKRKRIKKMASDSNNIDVEMKNLQRSIPVKDGRKNIRKVLKDKQVAKDTKLVAKEEQKRLKRFVERQALYNKIYEMRLANEEKVDKLVLDFNTKTKQELVTIHEKLVKHLKPHQAQGIKFMWDACFESLERVKTTSGSGCILAHCMGLGKTLQVIALTHTLLTRETNIKTVLIVCPLNTILNWLNEYDIWLKDLDDIEVYELTKFKKNVERRNELQKWQKTGGVMIIGYEMFRNLTNSNKKIRKNMKNVMLECLVDPGADLIVCDEGHVLKNENTALSKCMKSVKTMRRIVLTGTPLQNNLIEYHCMMQFVKPNLLGTKKEFLNRFVNPIENGQFDDSTSSDVKLMKQRAHVLHKMLEGSVQRFDYSVLTPFLPPKQEYVIFVRLTDTQIKMYQYYLNNLAKYRAGQKVQGLFADFQALQRIWTHPVALRLNAEKIEKLNEKKLEFLSESEGSITDFIDDNTTDTENTSNSDSSSDSDVQTSDGEKDNTYVLRRSTRNNPGKVESEEETPKVVTEWWSQFVQPEHFEDMKVSAKLLLLFGILKECEQIGDKVLVFSQSLYSLTLIEEFLRKINDQTQNGTPCDTLDNHIGNWSLGLDYFRLDGQTSSKNRDIWCKIFNSPTNTRARLFLISTRAGGLGINLIAANRVIVFDASWNPSHDIQSIFRIYRFGQKKPCYVYRILATGTMEEKIYNRQITKLSLSCRVVDEQQIERHYTNQNVNELYMFEGYDDRKKSELNLPKDRLLADIFLKLKDIVKNYHEHDSLLENKAEEELNEEERKQAWLEYEKEKEEKSLINPMMKATSLNQDNMLLQQDMMMNFVLSSTQNKFEYKNRQLIRKEQHISQLNKLLSEQSINTNKSAQLSDIQTRNLLPNQNTSSTDNIDGNTDKDNFYYK